ncbi:MAG: GntR family transcriptional regulator, partial [Rhizobiaceae bacterium]
MSGSDRATDPNGVGPVARDSLTGLVYNN